MEDTLPESLELYQETRFLNVPESQGALEGRWKIITAETIGDYAMDYLVDCPVDTRAHSGLTWGPSVRYWRVLADFARLLVDHKLYTPGAICLEGRYYPGWQAVIPESLEERWRELADAVPPICRSLMLDDEGTRNSVEKDALALSFVDACVDHLMRQMLTRRGGIVYGSGKKARTAICKQWLMGLRKSVLTPLEDAPHKLRELSAEVNNWNAGLRPVAADKPVRLGFRMHSPETGEGRWRLDFLLCSARDLAIQVDAVDVWSNNIGDEAEFVRPQEMLLSGLGQATGHMKLLNNALSVIRPIGLELSKPQALEFIGKTAQTLERSGFAVFLPEWVTDSASNIGLKLRVSSHSGARTDREHLLGVDQLVAYQWTAAVGETNISENEFRDLAKQNEELIFHDGQWMRVDLVALKRTVEIFDKDGIEGTGTLADVLHDTLAHPARGGLPVLDLQVQGNIEQLFRDLVPGEAFDVLPTPEGFIGTLRDYQVVGFSWMWFLSRLGFGGCLADDMGLGKTIQMIAYLLRDHQSDTDGGPSLVICPMSVVGNWVREIERFGPELRVLVHHGGDRAMFEAFRDEANATNVVITTYTLVVRDQPTLLSCLWRNVILDEAQNIKNPSTKQTIAIRSLRSAHRFALTGTPVENRLAELWSIMEFLNPGYLGSLNAFRLNFALPIERDRDHSQLGILKKLINPFLLRRLKTDKSIVRDLPDKLEMKVYCNLTTEQATLYQNVVDSMLSGLDDAAGINRKGLVLSTLTKLKQITNHPLHFKRDNSKFLSPRSGKLQRLEEMVEVVLQEGDKALIFTQFAELGHLLQAKLIERFGVEVFFLHGGTPQWRRDEMVHRFQRSNGPPIFLLSLRAGGTGLNLTAASHVFHYDRWWNPAVENQATDRAHRIGQERQVQVHKFVCIGTVEERIDQMIEEKKTLADSIVPSGEQLITGLDTEELRDLFRLSANAVSE
jgi:SNF2 family DNA or RNA helicase